MRDKDQQGPQGSGFGDVFAELTDRLRVADDVGMTAFEAKLRDYQAYLTKKFVTRKKQIPDKELNRIDEDLCGEWPHEGDVAKISGRVYLYDPNKDEIIPPEWGEPHVDENDDEYYLLEGVRMRSVTAETIPKYDEDGTAVDVKLAYTFAFLDDEDEMPVICAFVGDLYEHQYNQPTAQEAIARLESSWPDQLNLIMECVHNDTKTSILHRLQYLTKELQDELSSSKQFRQYFERYIQELFPLDKTSPYSITVEGVLDFFEGTADPYNDDAEGEWLPFTVDGSLSLLGFYPKIQVQLRADGTADCTVLLATYSQEKKEDAEYIRLYIGNVTSLRSTRALHSLLSRAMFDGERGSIIEAAPPEDENELDPVDSRGEVEIDFAPQGKTEVETLPEHVEELLAVEKAMNAAIKIVQAGKKIFYSLPEEAEQAAQNLIDDEILPLFIEIKHLSNLECVISGQGVVVPQYMARFIEPVENDASIQFVYSNEKQNATTTLLPGDSYVGSLIRFAPAVDVVISMDGKEPQYTMQPSLLVSIERTNFHPISISRTPLVEIAVDKRAFVPLDGTAEVKLKVLEDFRDVQAILSRLSTEHANSSVHELFKTLHEALINDEDATMYVEFEHSGLFSNLGDLGGDARQLSTAVEIFEKLLLGRRLQLDGGVIIKNANHTYIEGEALRNDVIVSGAIVDVRTDIRGDDIYLALGGENGVVVYVLARSITKFMF